ncbi:hypothetical protein PR003_g9235 [Phytophthora rubi]|uniref:DUF659 domain-containing protein n=2 Tax=Phytophthora rubi TaxID=129364 RepID=A0A6A4FH99_9STRA|nr:hypothetical protein PR003_g9235 [Phytophthora rubi]
MFNMLCGQKLGKEKGTLFVLMFAGWSHAGIHYVALYAVFETDGKLRFPLLGLSPLEDSSQTADAQIKLFGNIIDAYDKTNDMVGFLVGDNRATNQSIAKSPSWLCESSVQPGRKQVLVAV